MPFLVFVLGVVLAVVGLIADSSGVGCLGAVVAGLGVLWLRRRYVTARPPGAAGFDALRAQSVSAKRRGDFAEAERLLMRAVDAGDPEAMFDMGRLIEERDGIEASERWFRMAAEHGHKVARTAFQPGAMFNRDGTTPLDH
ncbi:hypothetical protein O7627_03055 [Solwaraspora sp. WMMD1047]|uniref:hypothetical protein n=1 Tax=Solwaraspora sp. WMMD1047 TaxID=3016102 RepID=UPI002417BDA4|nr:hypothetical protein [Solwaraspora sp. WMMD1047]MDG4828283.1 hypothetical protein [Solwaraspora sp. WMMD1047]